MKWRLLVSNAFFVSLLGSAFPIRFCSAITLVTHASPAGVYAHTAHRDWENNEDVRLSACDESQIDDIAKQLVYGETGSQLKVIFGGGRKNFHNSTTFDEEGNPGSRSDGRNLIQEWLHRGKEGAQRHYARNKVSSCQKL